LIYLYLFSKIVRAFAASTNVKEEVEVFIDGKSVMIEQGAALIQACEKAGADVCQN
jgi:NADH dehydrogenase (ubiquinone) Fe-S protein 1